MHPPSTPTASSLTWPCTRLCCLCPPSAPACPLQVLKTPQRTLVSSIFFMCLPDKVGVGGCVGGGGGGVGWGWDGVGWGRLRRIPGYNSVCRVSCRSAGCLMFPALRCFHFAHSIACLLPACLPALPPACLPQVLVYGDCAVNVEPNAEELAQASCAACACPLCLHLCCLWAEGLPLARSDCSPPAIAGGCLRSACHSSSPPPPPPPPPPIARSPPTVASLAVPARRLPPCRLTPPPPLASPRGWP